jgi:hypothetical protein
VAEINRWFWRGVCKPAKGSSVVDLLTGISWNGGKRVLVLTIIFDLQSPMLRRCARRHASTYLSKRLAKAEEISTFPEILQRDIFLNDLNHGEPSMRPHATSSTTAPLQMSKQDLNTCLDAGLLTFALHIESRISSALGEGF